MLHFGAVRAGLNVDAGVLLVAVVAGVGDDHAFDDDVGGDDADGVVLAAAIDRGAFDAAQRDCFVDAQVFLVAGALHFDDIAVLGAVYGRLDGLARPDRERGRCGMARQGHAQEGCGQPSLRGWTENAALHASVHRPVNASSQNSAAPMSRFLKPT